MHIYPVHTNHNIIVQPHTKLNKKMADQIISLLATIENFAGRIKKKTPVKIIRQSGIHDNNNMNISSTAKKKFTLIQTTNIINKQKTHIFTHTHTYLCIIISFEQVLISYKFGSKVFIAIGSLHLTMHACSFTEFQSTTTKNAPF